jgi:hypothetical protein
MRRITLCLSSFIVLSAAFLATGSPAFAARVAIPDGGGPTSSSLVAHHPAGGLATWAVAVIVIGGVVVAGLAGRLVRSSLRHAPAPAAG